MFRPQVFRRAFSLWRGVSTSHIARSAVRDGHEISHIKRVRITKSRKLTVVTTLSTGAVIGLLLWLNEKDQEEVRRNHPTPRRRRSAPSDKQEGEISDKGPEEDHKDDEDKDEEDEVLFFLPTGFSRPKPRTFYKGRDPEWQEFRKLANDKARQKRLQDEFVEKIRRDASTLLKKRLGNVDRSKGARWVEIGFPDGPPQEYERPGYELTKDVELRRTTRPVDPIHHQKLSQTICPTAAASALYVDAKKKLHGSWLEFKEYMGWTPKDQTQEAFPRIQASLKSLGSSSPPPSVVASPPAAPDAQVPTPSPSSSTPSSTAPNQPGAIHGNNSLARFLPTMPPSSLTMNMTEFRMNYAKAHKPYKREPPRGAVIVSGLVQLVGDRAMITLDATGYYDPKVGQFLIIVCHIRSARDKQQQPKGGH